VREPPLLMATQHPDSTVKVSVQEEVGEAIQARSARANVFTDRERWIITGEISEIVGKEAMKIDPEKLRGFVKEFTTVLLLFLGGKSYTKGQVLKAIEVIVSESEGLDLSYNELLEGFRRLVEEVSFTTGCISRFNEPGGPESPPFLVLNREALDNAVRESLELLASRALSLV